MHSWSLPVLLILTLIALAYLRGWHQLGTAFPGVLQVWRPAAFFAGLFILLAATASPLAMLDHHYLTAHMAQHLLIMTVAAPLILLGAPVITLLHGLPPSLSRQFYRRAVLHWIGPVITHPVFCWLTCTAVVIGWHVPAVFEMGMRSELGHGIEQSCFLIAGILFWWPVIRPWPTAAKWPVWSIPVYLFLAALPCDALSAFLCLCNRVVYSHYLPGEQSLDISALQDQACAGALMWFWVTFAYLFPAAALTFRLLSPEKRFLEKQVV
jgi:putative membrane protein